MRYLLDSNVVITYLNRRSTVLVDRFLATPTEDIALCSVVRAELRYGAMRSRDPQRTIARQSQLIDRFLSLPFCDRAADIFGEERARLGRLGTPIGTRDLQIAAIALANQLTLVTHNLREFERVQGLALEDWEVP
ncbi:MAG: PIN domain-containing protein [Geitlerinemataceae cyanobacterium]